MTVTLDPKDPGVNTEYVIDWYDQLVMPAERETAFPVGAIVQFQPDTGWLYECTTAGRTAKQYPRQIARISGVAFNDGSLVWTCRHPDLVTLTAVQSATWDVPSGILLVSQTEVGTLTKITLSGGSDGDDYTLTCHMTPTVGNPLDQSIIVPVRSL